MMETIFKKPVSPIVNRVLSAGTIQQAEQRTRETIERMKTDGQQLKGIIHFIDSTVSELASLPSSKMNYQQWNLAKNAGLSLQQIRNELLRNSASGF